MDMMSDAAMNGEAKERDRTPRSREELARFIDYSVLEEAMSTR